MQLAETFSHSMLIGNMNVNTFDPVTVNVDKLWNVNCAVCCGSVVDQDCRAVISIGVQMGKIHLGVR